MHFTQSKNARLLNFMYWCHVLNECRVMKVFNLNKNIIVQQAKANALESGLSNRALAKPLASTPINLNLCTMLCLTGLLVTLGSF